MLGYRYGPYITFWDIATVNKYWDVDRVGVRADGQLLRSWARCYGPKPAWVVEIAEELLLVMQDKFHFDTAYCDIHTCWTPSERTDYDSRVPGAGTQAAVFYAYGELFLTVKKIFNGPVYSEGGIHWQYSGLTDGNYAQDGYYEIQKNPWIVDFDLRKMHDLNCNFGMGYLDMFYTRGGGWAKNRKGWDAVYDRFLAATVAFGHPGFLGTRGGINYTFRCYYMLQQLQTRYTLASAKDIRYVTADGKLLDSSEAIASGVYKRSQVAVRYDNGTVVVSNGNTKERLHADVFGRKVNLPPNGYTGWSSDGGVYVCSSDEDGHRYDYAVSPKYIFIDGRGKLIRKPKASCKGVGICRILPDGYEIIPFEGSNPGFAIDAINAVALDYDRKIIGPAKLREKNGLTYVEPVECAFSYKLKMRKSK